MPKDRNVHVVTVDVSEVQEASGNVLTTDELASMLTVGKDVLRYEGGTSHTYANPEFTSEERDNLVDALRPAAEGIYRELGVAATNGGNGAAHEEGGDPSNGSDKKRRK
jgi:hypothetical protein